MATEKIGCDFMTGPVTALHTVCENIVLAGIGSYLHSFDVHEQKNISCTLVLPFRCIHGIIGAFPRQTDSEILAVFGEKCLTVLDLKWEDKNKPQVKVKNPSIAITTKVQMTEFEDWIWDAVFLNPRETCSLALALGHNSVIMWNWKLQKIVEKVSCVESCILYCAKFINSHWDNLVLAAGTVFNEILLWSPKGQRSQSGHISVLKSLKGHKGVIFSVDYMHQKRMMCSASDDRSIRLWQFTFDDQCQMYHDAEMSVESWENCSCVCVQVLYGHSARVWDVRLLTSTLVSVGEDSTCCVWNYEGSVLQKFKGHWGKSIWSLSVDEKERYVVTGGGDASVRLWYLSSRSERSHYITQSLQLPEMPSEKEDDYPRSASLLNYNEIIIITNEGFLYLYEMEEKRWQTVMSDSEFRSYTVMTVSPADPRCITLGNIHGKLRIFVANGNPSIWQAKDWEIYAGKIMNIHWLAETKLLTTGPEGEIKLWSFDVDSLTLECCEQYTLPECKQRWVSAAAAGQGSLICGDRGGTIHVYPLGGRSKNPLQSFPKIHGKTGVTDIIFHGDSIYTTGRDGCYRVFSHNSGHMTLLNTYRVYKGFEWINRLEIAEEGADYHVFGFQSSDFVLWSVNRNQKLLQIPCGGGHRSWDCNTNGNYFRFVYQKNREVVVCDTRLEQNQIKLKNALHGREITCAKFLEASSNKCIIVTGSEDTRVQISEIRYNEFGVKEITCLENLNGHISSVRTLCLSPSSKNAEDKHSSLMFSAGGRAQLLVWRLTAGNHTSIITESLCSYMIGQSQRKGRTRMWKLQQIKLNPETRFMDLNCVQVSSVWSDFPNHIHILASACSDAYVRFYIFEEERRDLHLFMESVFHEHCVLKVCCLTNHNGVDPAIYVLSAATDGCIAFWKIDRDKIHLILQRFYESSSNKAKNHETIPTKYRTATPNDFNLRENSPEKDSVIMSFHDEQVQVNNDSNSDNKDTVCDESEKSQSKAEPVLVLRHHQSGINGLDWCHCQENDFLIASGGDDNALVISLIKINSDGLAVSAKGSCLSAHATEITGVKFMSRTKLMSVSIDQRLIVWNVRITDNLIQLKQLYSKFVCVADISNMDCKKIDTDGYKVVISGEGLATFEVQDIYESEDC